MAVGGALLLGLLTMTLFFTMARYASMAGVSNAVAAAQDHYRKSQHVVVHGRRRLGCFHRLPGEGHGERRSLGGHGRQSHAEPSRLLSGVREHDLTFLAGLQLDVLAAVLGDRGLTGIGGGGEVLQRRRHLAGVDEVHPAPGRLAHVRGRDMDLRHCTSFVRAVADVDSAQLGAAVGRSALYGPGRGGPSRLRCRLPVTPSVVLAPRCRGQRGEHRCHGKASGDHRRHGVGPPLPSVRLSWGLNVAHPRTGADRPCQGNGVITRKDTRTTQRAVTPEGMTALCSRGSPTGRTCRSRSPPQRHHLAGSGAGAGSSAGADRGVADAIAESPSEPFAAWRFPVQGRPRHTCSALVPVADGPECHHSPLPKTAPYRTPRCTTRCIGGEFRSATSGCGRLRRIRRRGRHRCRERGRSAHRTAGPQPRPRRPCTP